MLDIKFIREQQDLIQEAARKKHIDFDVRELITADDERRRMLGEVEGLRTKQNILSGNVERAVPGEREELIAQSRALKEQLQKKEAELADTLKRWQSLMVRVPNIPDMSVPDGVDDGANKELRSWGTPPQLGDNPASHIDLMQRLSMVDFERGTKVSGFRGYFLIGEGVTLSFALWNYALSFLTKRGFTPMLVPSLVHRETLLGTGYIPQGEEDLYKTQDSLYLSGTAEVATMAYYMNEAIPAEILPLRLVAFSPCFRREAGSHGKDTKGLVRVHEFYKIEQVVLCEASHEESVKLHEEITRYAEEFMQSLRLPYRVVVNAAGDLGLGQVKKYDIEVWMPSEKKYRETHSASYFHDFQTRRLNIRYRDKEGKLRFAHSLNSTCAPTPRLLAALVENCQAKAGGIVIPDVLVPYMEGKKEIVPPRV